MKSAASAGGGGGDGATGDGGGSRAVARAATAGSRTCTRGSPPTIQYRVGAGGPAPVPTAATHGSMARRSPGSIGRGERWPGWGHGHTVSAARAARPRPASATLKRSGGDGGDGASKGVRPAAAVAGLPARTATVLTAATARLASRSGGAARRLANGGPNGATVSGDRAATAGKIDLASVSVQSSNPNGRTVVAAEAGMKTQGDRPRRAPNNCGRKPSRPSSRRVPAAGLGVVGELAHGKNGGSLRRRSERRGGRAGPGGSGAQGIIVISGRTVYVPTPTHQHLRITHASRAA